MPRGEEGSPGQASRGASHKGGPQGSTRENTWASLLPCPTQGERAGVVLPQHPARRWSRASLGGEFPHTRSQGHRVGEVPSRSSGAHGRKAGEREAWGRARQPRPSERGLDTRREWRQEPKAPESIRTVGRHGGVGKGSAGVIVCGVQTWAGVGGGLDPASLWWCGQDRVRSCRVKAGSTRARGREVPECVCLSGL